MLLADKANHPLGSSKFKILLKNDNFFACKGTVNMKHHINPHSWEQVLLLFEKENNHVCKVIW
jgi:hypothetical protein